MLLFADSVKLMRNVIIENCKMLQDLYKLQEWENILVVDGVQSTKCKVMRMGKRRKDQKMFITINGKQLQEFE